MIVEGNARGLACRRYSLLGRRIARERIAPLYSATARAQAGFPGRQRLFIGYQTGYLPPDAFVEREFTSHTGKEVHIEAGRDVALPSGRPRWRGPVAQLDRASAF